MSDWQLTEEAQRRALAELVQAISRLDATSHWGEGRTSASDGQRFAMPRKVLQQTFSTRFSDYALEFYSFIADNYAPFYSTPIECALLHNSGRVTDRSQSCLNAIEFALTQACPDLAYDSAPHI